MSSIEESQTLPTLSDAITSGSNSNPTKKNIRTNFRESKEVNEKISELISDRHKNDINEGKDDNDSKLKNKSFLDRIKKKGKQEDISQENEENEKLEDMIQIKENEPTMTLTTLNDLIENKNENEIKEQKNDECSGTGVWENKFMRYDGYFKSDNKEGQGTEIYKSELYKMENPPLKFVGTFKKGEKNCK